MTSLANLLCLFALTLFLSGCDDPLTKRFDYNITRERLSNGLTVILVEDHDMPVVSYNTWFRVGSAWERVGKTGIAHLFEHLMFKGTSKHPDQDYTVELEKLGASVNAYTQKDVTVYYQIFAPQHLERVVALESERLTGLRLDEKNLKAEKKVVLEERRMRIDGNYISQMFEELALLAFPTHPYGTPVIGYEEDIEQISLEDCINFQNTYYQPANAIVSIVGNINAAQTMELIKKQYEKIPSRPVPQFLMPEQESFNGERRKVLIRPVQAESLVIAYRVPPIDHPDSPALSILSWALFDISSSRANEILVRDKQVALHIGAEVEKGMHSGLFTITAELRKGVPAEAVEQEINTLINDIKITPLSDQEIERVKNILSYSIVSKIKSAEGVASLLMVGEYYYENIQEAFGVIKRYNAVDKSDLLRVARMYFNSNDRMVVLLKPKEQP